MVALSMASAAEKFLHSPQGDETVKSEFQYLGSKFCLQASSQGRGHIRIFKELYIKIILIKKNMCLFNIHIQIHTVQSRYYDTAWIMDIYD